MIPVEDSLIQKIDTRIRRHDNMDTREQCLDFKRMEIECKKFTGYPFLLSAEGRRVLGSVIWRKGDRNDRTSVKRAKLCHYEKILCEKGIPFAENRTGIISGTLAICKGCRRVTIILDTPSVAHASHRFYEKSGFCRIDKSELPVPYSYPDRKSILYMLEL